MGFKKIIAICITLLLIFTLLVGCTTPQDQEEEGQQEQETPQEDNQQQDETTTQLNLEDGIYTAEGEADERGWKPVATIIVENKMIDQVFYDEVNEEGQALKGFDGEYFTKMKEASGETPFSAVNKLSSNLKNNGDPDKVDSVSGATSTSDHFKEVTKKALDSDPQSSEDGFPNGIFKAYGDEDERGYQQLAAILVSDGEIQSIDYDEYHEENNTFKTYDEEYATSMKEKTDTTPKEAVEELITSLKEKENPEEVDDVSGATHTSTSFKELMEKIFKYLGK